MDPSDDEASDRLFTSDTAPAMIPVSNHRLNLMRKQLPPPANWQDFESLCRDLFAAEWGDPETEKNGRPGQVQAGVDVVGLRQRRYRGAQCKLRRIYPERRLSRAEVLQEVAAARKFDPELEALVIATTAPPDAEIQKLARKISTEHAKSERFRVLIWDWEKICDRLAEHPVGRTWEEKLLSAPRPRDPKSGLTAIPPEPPHHLPRPEDLAALKRILLEESSHLGLTGAGKAGLHGMGGIGKTVLAGVLAADAEVEAAFPDGIFWLTVGQTPRLEELQSQLAGALGEPSAVVGSVLEGKRVLQGCLKDRRVLVVLDDVWENAHALAFDVFQAPAQVLVTTRNAQILSRFGAAEHRVDLLSEAASLELLASWAGCECAALPAIAQEVAKACGYLPLALAMVGAMVRRRPTGWEDALVRLGRVQLDKLERSFEDYPYPNLLRALAASVEALEEEDRNRYLELAVFPEDVVVPEATLETLWSAVGLDDLDTRDLLDRLEDRSLLRRTGSGGTQLHDLQGDFIRHQVEDEVALHRRLVDAYGARCRDGFASGPDDGYFFERLPEHLDQADRREELRELLLEFEWVRAKLEATNIRALLEDYRRFEEDDEVHFLHDALRLTSHILARDKSQLAVQIPARTLRKPEFLGKFRAAARADRPPHCLVPRFPHLLEQAGGPTQQTLVGHTKGVTSVAVLDSDRVVSASHDRTLRVWDIASGETLQILEGHTDGVLSVAVLDSGRVVSASEDGTLRIWDIASGETQQTLEGHPVAVISVALLDSDHVVSASHGILRVWDVTSGELLQALGANRMVNSVAALDSGRVVCASSDNTLWVWDMALDKTQLFEEMQMQMLLEPYILKDHTYQQLEGQGADVLSVAVLDSGRVVSASQDGTLRVWDVASSETLQTLKDHTARVNSVAVLDSGRVVSASLDGTVRVWDVESGEPLQILEGHTAEVLSVAVLDSGRVVSASLDRTIRVWDVAASESPQTLEGHTDGVNSVAVLDSGRVVSASKDRIVRVWDVASGKTLQTLEGHTNWIDSVAVLDSGRVVSASWDGTFRVWDVASGETLQTLEIRTSVVKSMAVLDSNRVVSASLSGTLRVWDVASGETLQTLEGHTDGVRSVAVLDSGRVVSASNDETLRVWDIALGETQQILEGHTAWVNSVAVLDSGRVVSASNDGTLRVWDVASGETLQTLKGHTDGVRSVAVLDSGRVVSSSTDGTLRVWDVASSETVAGLTLDALVVVAAVVERSPSLMVAGDSRGLVHILELWEPHT